MSGILTEEIQAKAARFIGHGRAIAVSSDEIARRTLEAILPDIVEAIAQQVYHIEPDEEYADSWERCAFDNGIISAGNHVRALTASLEK